MQPKSVPAMLLSQRQMNSKLIFLSFTAHSRFCLARGAEYVLSLTFPLSFGASPSLLPTSVLVNHLIS